MTSWECLQEQRCPVRDLRSDRRHRYIAPRAHEKISFLMMFESSSLIGLSHPPPRLRHADVQMAWTVCCVFSGLQLPVVFPLLTAEVCSPHLYVSHEQGRLVVWRLSFLSDREVKWSAFLRFCCIIYYCLVLFYGHAGFPHRSQPLKLLLMQESIAHVHTPGWTKALASVSSSICHDCCSFL